MRDETYQHMNYNAISYSITIFITANKINDEQITRGQIWDAKKYKPSRVFLIKFFPVNLNFYFKDLNSKGIQLIVKNTTGKKTHCSGWGKRAQKRQRELRVVVYYPNTKHGLLQLFIIIFSILLFRLSGTCDNKDLWFLRNSKFRLIVTYKRINISRSNIVNKIIIIKYTDV